MVLMRSLMFLTFDGDETEAEKRKVREVFIQQGYEMISETVIDATKCVKEWILRSPVRYAALETSSIITPKREGGQILKFDPERGAKR